MPKLIKMYITHCVAGFGLSALFVGALLFYNIANLGHLVSTSPVGWIAVGMLFFGNGIVFAGVQFAISIMRMGEGDGPSGGRRAPRITGERARVTAEAAPRRDVLRRS
ncbi:hypothetical protein J4E08_09570 [Sagittula sp. NFXS13]|uniref:Uncharacterized protein n=1 Tax=Sagittula marina TaxID=943940 RepID=A0A7W6GRG6_9RHOB|nr:hypothetical protein [Sagittula marina]MBB3984573.1 hypothetical protein [Sagittula marina]